MKNLFYCLAALAACVASCLSAQESNHSDSNLVGEWRGTSACQVRESACHDEDSVYHITPITGKPSWFSLRGDKVVDGKPITMGTLDCSYDYGKSALACQSPRGVFRFNIRGNKMEGTMALPNGTLWRKITLTKAK